MKKVFIYFLTAIMMAVSVFALDETDTSLLSDELSDTAEVSTEEFEISESVAEQYDAFTGTCGTRAYWSLDTNSGLLTITGEGAINDYELFTDKPTWYNYADKIKRIVIADGIDTIGRAAFAGHDYTNLTDVDIPESVVTISTEAFAFCKGIIYINFPGNLRTIGERAFWGSGLMYADISRSIYTIGSGAFSDCMNLQSISVPRENNYYASDENGCLYNKNYHTLYCVPATKSNFEFRDSITAIEAYAFSGNNYITSFEIPDRVTYVGDALFSNCENLTYVKLPNNIKYITKSMFANCNSLQSITIPDSVIKIDTLAFTGCYSLTKIDIPVGVQYIAYGAFQNTSIEYLTIPATVTYIESNAVTSSHRLKAVYFAGDRPNMSTTTLPRFFEDYTSDFVIYYRKDANGWSTPTWNGYKTVALENTLGTYNYVRYSFDPASGVLSFNGRGAMEDFAYGEVRPWDSYASLIKTIEIGSNITSIGSYSFRALKNLENVIISEGRLVSIGKSAFSNCTNLTSISLPSSLESIGNSAFIFCESLTSITIPSNVTKIGDTAFNYCAQLNSAYFNGNAPTFGTGVFDSCANGFIIYYPYNATDWGYSSTYYGYKIEPIFDVLIAGYDITLTECICLNVYFKVNKDNGVKVDLLVPLRNKQLSYLVSELPVDNKTGLYRASVELSAKEMGEYLYIELYDSDNILDLQFISVSDYIYSPAMSDSKTANLVNAMLKYGGCAQRYFKHNEYHYADQDISDSFVLQNPYETHFIETGSVTGLTYEGTSLLLKTKTGLRHYFKLDGSKNDYSVKYSNETYTTLLSIKDTDTPGLYYVDLPSGIVPKNFDNQYMITVSKNSEKYTLSYSVNDAIYSVVANSSMYESNFVELMKALYTYGYYAEIY